MISRYSDADVYPLRNTGGDYEGAFDRRAAIWGLVIGWLMTPTINYGEQITVANITRLVAAVQDPGTLEAIGD
jgi:hypothetical protein